MALAFVYQHINAGKPSLVDVEYLAHIDLAAFTAFFGKFEFIRKRMPFALKDDYGIDRLRYDLHPNYPLAVAFII